MSNDNRHSWVDPIVPDEEDRVAYLRYKFENGQLHRQYEQRNNNDSAITIIAFQEDPAVTPLVGDEALRTVIRDCGNDTFVRDYDLITLTSEIIDCTDPAPNLAPTDIALTNNTISESTPIGELIGELSTFDPNIGDTHTYSIVNDPDNKFQITGNKLRLKNLLDYDTSSTHSVTIRTTDQGLLSFDKVFTIFVVLADEFVNDKATLFQGDTITKDMVGPASDQILPGNGSFTMSTWVKKDNPSFSNIQSVDFDGIDGFMNIANPSNFHFNNGSNDTPFTISAWVKMDDATTFRIACKGSASNRELLFTTSASDDLIVLLYSDASNNLFRRSSSPVTSDEGSWVHYAVTYDGSGTTGGLTLYRNGAVLASVDNSSGTYTGLNDSGENMLIGRFEGITGEYANGEIDEVSFYSSEYNASQIATIYNSGKPNDLSTKSDIFAWYRMGDGDTAPTIADQINSNNGTLNGGATIVSSTLLGDSSAISDPSNVSGLHLWLDANDETTITQTANKISQWNDKSGNNYNLTQGISGSQPELKPNGYGLRNTVLFDGADDFMTTNIPGTLDEMTVFIVSKYNQLNQGSGDFDYLYSYGTNSANQLVSLARRASGSFDDDYYLFDGGTTLNGPNLDGQVFTTHVQRINNTATFHEYFKNGVSEVVTDNDVAFSVSGTFDLGRYLTGTHYLDGEIAEIIIYNRSLNNTERETIETYLTQKWVNGVDVGFKTLAILHQDPSGSFVVPEVVDTPNLVGWYEAGESTSIEDTGGLVDQWNDISGNGNHFTQTGAQRPTLITDGGSGASNRPVLRFNGSNQSLVGPGTITGATGRTIFIVSRAETIGTGAMWTAYDGPTTAGTGYDITPETGIRVRSGNRIFNEDTEDPVAFTVLAVRSAPNSNSTDVQAWINGTELTEASVDAEPLNTGVGNSLIGRAQNNTHYNGDIAEIIIYDRDLSNTERADIEQYLTNKWINGIDPLITMGEPKAELRWNESDTIQMRYFNGISTQTLETIDNYGDNEYHNIVGRYNSISGEVELFVDADQKDSNSDVIVGTGSGLARIGSFNGLAPFYDGLMDEVSIWDNPINVNELYNSGFAQDLLNNSNLTGLKLWLRMGDLPDNFLISEGILDRSGNGNHFTANSMSNSNCVNDAVSETPNILSFKSLPFNGTDQYGDTNDSTDFSDSGDFSVSLWYKGTGPDYIISQAQVTSPGYSSDWIIGLGSGPLFWMKGTTLGNISSINDNQWHHLVLSWNRTTETFTGYIDGGSIGESSTVVGYGAEPGATVKVATRGDGTSNFSQGNLDEISMWNKALDATEVSELYNAGAPSNLDLHSAVSDRIHWWRMGENSGDNTSTVIDIDENNDMTLFNFTGDPYETETPSASTFVDQKSVEFNGIDQLAVINADSNDDLFGLDAGTTGYPFTISTWFKTTGPSTGSDDFLILQGVNSNNIYTRLQISGSTVRLQQRNSISGDTLGNLNTNLATGGAGTDGNWHHVIICFVSPTETRFRFDGGPVQIAGGRNVWNREIIDSFSIGGRVTNTGGATAFSAIKIGDTAVWNVAIPDDAMLDIYNSGKAFDLRTSKINYIQSANLQAYWLMGDRSSDIHPVITDASGNELALAMYLFHPNADGFVIDAP